MFFTRLRFVEFKEIVWSGKKNSNLVSSQTTSLQFMSSNLIFHKITSQNLNLIYITSSHISTKMLPNSPWSLHCTLLDLQRDQTHQEGCLHRDRSGRLPRNVQSNPNHHRNLGDGNLVKISLMIPIGWFCTRCLISSKAHYLYSILLTPLKFRLPNTKRMKNLLHE